MTDAELERLLREARDGDAAMADLDGCVLRLRRAQLARVVLARMPVGELRAVLRQRRDGSTVDR